MRSKKSVALAVFAVAILLVYGVARLAPDMDCHDAPSPECLLSIANDTARLIDKPVPHVQALIAIGSAEAAADHADRAAATIAEARRIADGPGLAGSGAGPEYKYEGKSDAEVRAMLHGDIIDAQARLGVSRKAIKETADHGDALSGGAEPHDFAAEIAAAAALADPFARDMALATISRTQAYSGDLDGALDTVLKIADRAVWSDAFDTVSFMLAQDGNAEGVWAAAREIPNDEMRDLTLERDVSILAMAGNPSGAASMADNITDPAARATAYAAIAWEMADPIIAAKSDGAKTEGKTE